jgi:putative oxygen-independent coproporphyrinogen III oxidase
VAGLYVHVPFCRSKCAYCNFYSVEPSRVPAWVDAVLDEARLRGPAFGRFETLYLGGGTPSLLSPTQLMTLLDGLRQIGDVDPDAEVTLEANPDDVTPAMLSSWRGLGVNRLSLGLQAIDDDALAMLGRRHTARQGLDSVRLARAAGFDNLGVDLLWGWTWQTDDDWTRALRRVLDDQPEHISCYQLTMEPGTPLGREARSGRMTLPLEEDDRHRYLRTSEILCDAGYEHYEISNFARTPALRSRHNQLYWHHEPYLGLGPAAHSFDGERRWWNLRSVEQYVERIGQGDYPTRGDEVLDDEQRTLEALMLGLRTSDGVPTEVVRRYGCGKEVVAAMQEEGLVTVAGSRILPTLEGFVLADGLPLRFNELSIDPDA